VTESDDTREKEKPMKARILAWPILAVVVGWASWPPVVTGNEIW